MTRDILKSVIATLLVGILVAAANVYVEVKMQRKDIVSLTNESMALRQEIKELRGDLDKLYGMTNDEVSNIQKHRR